MHVWLLNRLDQTMATPSSGISKFKPPIPPKPSTVYLASKIHAQSICRQLSNPVENYVSEDELIRHNSKQVKQVNPTSSHPSRHKSSSTGSLETILRKSDNHLSKNRSKYNSSDIPAAIPNRKSKEGSIKSISTLFDQLIDNCDRSIQGDSGRESLIHQSQETACGNQSGTISESEEDDQQHHQQCNGFFDKIDSKEKKAFLTAKEIASSERVFVECLQLICVDFRAAVSKAKTDIPDEELSKILSNLPCLQHLNKELLSDFEESVNNWSTLPKISNVFIRKGPFLKSYSTYIRDFQSQSALLDECIQKYPKFAETLKIFEMSDRSKGLPLKHHIIKPVQRLPQYRLLLEAYLNHLNESSLDYKDTIEALKIVSQVAQHANDSMKLEVNIVTIDLRFILFNF